ncbi:tripeptidyl-peptidase-like protein [Rhizodiscina lignyota]|uniref:tripeptidyl-peptidase II n=1 Tax=Rhizodiscina lignyota TaxID=1504668 RepID=A0A9P4IJ61_9PEZI|nr:tripeptidyl-peptidase-like protein [Rhizodiscina lignyota]
MAPHFCGTTLLFLFSCLFLTATTTSSPFDLVHSVPEGWSFINYPQPEDLLYLYAATTSSNLATLEQAALDASTPGHKLYGHHLKRHEVQKLLGASQQSHSAIRQWFAASGISDAVEDGVWIRFNCSVSQAEALLDTTFQVFKDPSGNSVIRTLNYSVPAEMQRHIEMIQPTTRFPRPQLQKTVSPLWKRTVASGVNTSDCSQNITPRCLQQQYNIKDVIIDPRVENTLAVNSFDENYAHFGDLAQFNKEFAPWANGKNFTWTSVNGGILNQTSTGNPEADLDVEYSMAISSLSSPSTAIRIHVFSTGGQGPTINDLNNPPGVFNEPWLEWLDFVLNLPDEELPQTMTISYADDEQTLPRGYARTVCNMFASLAARGVSVLIGSGDWGPGVGCQSNDGKNRSMFIPVFPSTCPWITSVGGTRYFDHEIANNLSSGGFSNYFARPSYQEAAVAGYLAKIGGKFQGLYNRSGRAFPDVAAQSHNYVVISDGAPDVGSGTSAAAPVFAGIVALLNGARMSAGKPPLGFLNPWIYGKAYAALNDITEGGSKGCTKSLGPEISGAGWNATKGWDPVTGYGTPNFEKLLRLALED